MTAPLALLNPKSEDTIPISLFRQLNCLVCNHPQEICYQTWGCLKRLLDNIHRIYADKDLVIDSVQERSDLRYFCGISTKSDDSWKQNS